MKRPNPRESLFERLVAASNSLRSAVVSSADECWVWNGSKCNKGYGQIWTDGRSKRVHIAAWELVKGRKVRRGHTLDHGCRNRACWRPSHMEEVTRAVNTARGNRANPRSTVAATAARREARLNGAERIMANEDKRSVGLGPLTNCDGPDSYE